MFSTNNIYTLDGIKAIVVPIAIKYNLPAMYIFGSYACGKATEKSDIGIMVDITNSKRK